MWNCLQLCSDDFDFVGEFERNRVALLAARAILHKKNDDKATLLAARAILRARMNDHPPSSTDFEASYRPRYLVSEIGARTAINPAAIRPRDYNCGTTLWIGCLITTLGEGLLGFISRFVRNLEKRYR